MNKLKTTILAFGLSLLFVNVMWGQFTVQVIATDGTKSDTLVLGTAVGATNAIDAGQGEVELPPTPPSGIFDARFSTFTGVALGQGTSKDLRGFTSAHQNATYKIKWQVATEGLHADSIVFSWPAGLATVGGGYWHMTGTGLDVNMATQTSATVSGDNPTVTVTTGDATAFTTFTYQRFQSDLDVKGKQKGNAKAVKVFSWPNVHNVGEELMLTSSNIPLAVAGSDLAVHSVLVKKYADMLKDFSVKGATHSPDSASVCLDFYPHLSGKGKIIKKQLSKIDPTVGKGVNSYLFAQLTTLKFNLKASGAKTPSGLGALVINDGGKFTGRTISSLASAGDSAFSCVAPVGVTQKEVCDELEKVNKAFNKSWSRGDGIDSAHCDTLAGVPWRVYVKNPLKPNALSTTPKNTLHLAGWVALAKVSWISNGATTAPVNTHNAIVENVKPAQYSLEQNYPNPFNPSTKIQFNMVNDGMVSVKVFNMLGQEVATLANQEMAAGMQTVTFDASSIASGVYFYRVTVNDLASGKQMFSDMKKMMLVK